MTAWIAPQARYKHAPLLVLCEQVLGEVGVAQRLTALPLGVVVGKRPGSVVEVAGAEVGPGVRDSLGQHLEDYILDMDLRLRSVVGSAERAGCPLLLLAFLVKRLNGGPDGVADEAAGVAGKVL